MAALLTSAVSAAGWGLFGFSRHTLGSREGTFHRFFGRVTRIDVLVGPGNTGCRERFLFSWSDPFVAGGHAMAGCAVILPESWADRNCDGRWDTWMRRDGPDREGRCRIHFRVDTDADGVADWRFSRVVEEYDEYLDAEKEITARRGF